MPEKPPMPGAEPGPENCPPAREPLRELTLRRSKPSADGSNRIVASSTQADTDTADIDAIAARCMAKAEAARWAAERQRRLREGYGWTDDDAPSDQAVVAWAERLTDAFYWANAAGSDAPLDITQLDLVGGCFETVAAALEFVKAQQDRKGGLERALKLLAEAQSALRHALRNLGAADDPDQLAIYEWLRSTAARHRIFLNRFMRADDLADPSGWPGLIARIESAAGNRPESQRQRATLDDLRSHLGQMSTQAGTTGHDWRSVIQVDDFPRAEGTYLDRDQRARVRQTV
jgi:hypothetical protein